MKNGEEKRALKQAEATNLKVLTQHPHRNTDKTHTD
jgi:hypothetical protein